MTFLEILTLTKPYGGSRAWIWSCRYYILMANFLVMALVPFTLLVGLNFKLYRTVQVWIEKRQKPKITKDVCRPIEKWFPFQESGARSVRKKRAREKREQKIASLLILLVIVFGCCNVVRQSSSTSSTLTSYSSYNFSLILLTSTSLFVQTSPWFIHLREMLSPFFFFLALFWVENGRSQSLRPAMLDIGFGQRII